MLKLALFLHIVSAIFWVGGMLFLSLVVAPFLKTIPDPKDRSKIYQFVGKKYRLFGWIAGPIILHGFYGITPGMYFSSTTLSTGFGHALAVKLVLVAFLLISSLVHDFFIGPRARGSKSYSLIAKIFGRGNLVVALFIIICAVFIRAGG
jgi:putative copper export protein